MNRIENFTEKEEDSHRMQSIIRKIRELEEIVRASSPQFTPTIPKGYTPARWQLALQSFNKRYPILKSRDYFSPSQINLKSSPSSSSSGPVPLSAESTGESDTTMEIEMGPEWELKCAQRELEKLLNK